MGTKKGVKRLISPRTARAIEQALVGEVAMIQAYLDDPYEAPGDLCEPYPRICAHLDKGWWRQQLECNERLIVDLERGRDPLPRCVGEEFALLLALDAAEILVADKEVNVVGLPERRSDFNFHDLPDLLMEDTDVLVLMNPALDGIEAHDPTTAARMGYAGLHPLEWFVPFSGRKLDRK